MPAAAYCSLPAACLLGLPCCRHVASGACQCMSSTFPASYFLIDRCCTATLQRGAGGGVHQWRSRGSWGSGRCGSGGRGRGRSGGGAAWQAGPQPGVPSRGGSQAEEPAASGARQERAGGASGARRGGCWHARKPQCRRRARRARRGERQQWRLGGGRQGRQSVHSHGFRDQTRLRPARDQQVRRRLGGGCGRQGRHRRSMAELPLSGSAASSQARQPCVLVVVQAKQALEHQPQL